jgi:hypothetical protein
MHPLAEPTRVALDSQKDCPGAMNEHAVQIDVATFADAE